MRITSTKLVTTLFTSLCCLLGATQAAWGFENTVRIQVSPERMWQCGNTKFWNTGGQQRYQIAKIYAGDQFLGEFDFANDSDCAKVIEHVADIAPNTPILIGAEVNGYRMNARFTGTDRHRIWASSFFVDHNNGQLLLDFAPARTRVFSVKPQLTGQHPTMNLSASLEVLGTDAGKTGQVHLVALAGNQMFAHDGQKWIKVEGSTLPVWMTTTRTDRIDIPVFTTLDVRLLQGVAVFAGYGLNLNDMVSRKLYGLIQAF
jgi:hypothetical protein